MSRSLHSTGAFLSALLLVVSIVTGSLSLSSFTVSAQSSACPIDPTDLIAYWKLDEGTGTMAGDSTGNGHTGSLVNGTAWSGTTAPTMFGNPAAASFDGNNDEITAPDTLLGLGMTNFTVSTWVKADPGDGDRAVLGHFANPGPGYRGWGLYLYNTNRVNFFGYGTMGSNDTSHAATVLNSGWHHVSGVYSRSGNDLTIRTYVDGVLVGSNTATVGDIAVSTPMMLGTYTFQNHYLGYLDDVRVYDRSLSGTEVAALSRGDCAYPASSSSSSTSSGSSESSSSSSSSSESSSSSSSSSMSSSSSSSSESSESSESSMSSSSSSSSDARLTCNGLPATIVGTNGNNILIGTPGDDVIVALGGNDVVNGRGGNDTICLGNGDDIANGNDGRDWISGGNGRDMIRGNDGRDMLMGDNGRDYLNGDNGEDALFGGNGDDLVIGGANRDALDGGNGRDICLAPPDSMVNCP